MSKNNYTLVIVDLQPDAFPAARCETTCRYARKAAKHAMKHGNNIIVVDWEGYDSEPKLMRILKDYGKYTKVLKDQCDGAYVVTPAMKEQDAYDKRIHICGVNTNACVVETAEGLRKALPNAELIVLKDACNGEFYGKAPDSHWDHISNVKFV
jgi:nicotinamidase-related amidase